MNSLYKALCLNTAISIIIFAVLFLLLWLAETIFPSLSLLKWNDASWCVGIPASVIGVAYVLTVRDPENYTGFYPGILMSLLLALQFFLQGNYDLTLLYICIFVPFQVKSILQWRKPATNRQTTPDPASQTNSAYSPEFLSLKQMLLSLLVFILIVIADWLLVTYAFNRDALFDSWLLKLLGALMIASSIHANFWLIYRKTDAWLYWVLYSISGMLFYIVVGNAFSIVLFLVFLLINSMAGVAWIRNTPRENYGWILGK
ncbi:MAG: nicotinamide mononucleotide transporter [Paludibacteraceae bacterium]|nr:nicotinamide mononucleotide transporter [Paludibacteraceae bacterium]